MQIVIYLLFANSVMHIVSFIALSRQKASNRMGVLAFAIINAAVGILLIQDFSWARWLALIFPAIGFTGLCITIKKSLSPKIVDYTILGLDAAIIISMVRALFF
jgi:hypothetical protein